MENEHARAQIFTSETVLRSVDACGAGSTSAGSVM